MFDAPRFEAPPATTADQAYGIKTGDGRAFNAMLKGMDAGKAAVADGGNRLDKLEIAGQAGGAGRTPEFLAAQVAASEKQDRTDASHQLK